MKFKIDGIEFEGTPKEADELIRLRRNGNSSPGNASHSAEPRQPRQLQLIDSKRQKQYRDSEEEAARLLVVIDEAPQGGIDGIEVMQALRIDKRQFGGSINRLKGVLRRHGLSPDKAYHASPSRGGKGTMYTRGTDIARCREALGVPRKAEGNPR